MRFAEDLAAPPHYRCSQPLTCHDYISVGGRALDLLVALLILFLFVALGVLGRADLASLGVDACATLSFAFHDFACGFGGALCKYVTNVCGIILLSGEPNIGTLVS